MPHPQLLRSIELYGTQVVPRVRELLAQETGHGLTGATIPCTTARNCATSTSTSRSRSAAMSPRSDRPDRLGHSADEELRGQPQLHRQVVRGGRRVAARRGRRDHPREPAALLEHPWPEDRRGDRVDEDDPALARVLEEQVDHLAEHRADPGGRVVRRGGEGGDRAVGSLDGDGVEDGDLQRLDALEALVEVARGQAGRLRDAAHRGGGDAALAHQLEPGGDQPRTALGGPLGGVLAAVPPRPLGHGHHLDTTVDRWVSWYLSTPVDRSTRSRHDRRPLAPVAAAPPARGRRPLVDGYAGCVRPLRPAGPRPGRLPRGRRRGRRDRPLRRELHEPRDPQRAVGAAAALRRRQRPPGDGDPAQGPARAGPRPRQGRVRGRALQRARPRPLAVGRHDAACWSSTPAMSRRTATG